MVLSAADQEKADAAALQKLVAEDDDLELVEESGRTKVHFKCTNHDEPARWKLVQEYMKGGKYRKAREWYSADFTKFEPDIVSHEQSPKFLMCKITGTTLPKTLAKVEAHMKSKRFQELKKQYDEREQMKAAKLEKKKALRQKLKTLWKAKVADGKAGEPTSRRKRKLAANKGEKKTEEQGKKRKAGKKQERAASGLRKKQFLAKKTGSAAVPSTDKAAK